MSSTRVRNLSKDSGATMTDRHETGHSTISNSKNVPSTTPNTRVSTPVDRPHIPTSLKSIETLPPGCKYGHLPISTDDETRGGIDGLEGTPVIWVDFPIGSPDNPFSFKPLRKKLIVIVAVFYTFMTAFASSSYFIGAGSMKADLGINQIQMASGLALYAWVSDTLLLSHEFKSDGSRDLLLLL